MKVKFKLVYKILILILGILILMTAVSTFLNVSQTRTVIYNGFEKSLSDHCKNLTNFIIETKNTLLEIGEEATLDKMDAVSERIQDINNTDKQIKMIFIIDEKGNVVKSFPPNMDYEFNNLPDKVISQKFVIDNEEYFGIFSPILDGNIKLGTIFLGVPYDLVQSQLNEMILRSILIGLAFIILTLGLLIIFNIQVVMKPLYKILTFSHDIGYGDLNAELVYSSTDEFSLLATSLNQMRISLIQAQGKMMEQERVKKEMEVAQKIQTSLLPTIPYSQYFEVSADMIPAEEVGGDYYDLMLGPDGRHWYGIGDVTGHGLISGLIMMMAQTAVYSSLKLQPDISLKDVIINVNRVLYENIRKRLGTDHFMTFSLLCSSSDGSFEYAGAHLDLIIYRKAKNDCEKIHTSGLWLALKPEMSNEKEIYTGKFILEQDDILLLYTDGLIEAFNKEKVQFDMNRLTESLIRHSSLPINDIKTGIIQDVNNFMEKQLDDITIVLIKKK